VIPRPDNPLIVALDVSDVDAAEAMARRLDG
jgi:orotidine-5'-phosphate decarboxylase